jgi:hypothetical protein
MPRRGQISKRDRQGTCCAVSRLCVDQHRARPAVLQPLKLPEHIGAQFGIEARDVSNRTWEPVSSGNPLMDHKLAAAVTTVAVDTVIRIV